MSLSPLVRVSASLVALLAQSGAAALPIAATPEHGPVPHAPIQLRGDAAFSLGPVSGVVAGSGTESDPYVISGWSFEIPAWDAGQLLSGIEIRDATVHVVVARNTFRTFGEGVTVTNSSHVTVVGNSFLGVNTAVNATASPGVRIRWNHVQTSGLGILVAGSSGALVEGNAFDDVSLGVAVVDASAAQLKSNRWTRSGAGALVRDSSNVLLEDHLQAAGRHGIEIERSDEVLVRGAQIAGVSLGITSKGGTGARVEASWIEDADVGVAANGTARFVLANSTVLGGGHGVVLASLEGARVHGNRILGSLLDGLRVVDSAGVVARRNDFEGNGAHAAVVLGGGTLDARRNWWGDPTGPQAASNPGGLGDAVSEGVLFGKFARSPYHDA